MPETTQSQPERRKPHQPFAWKTGNDTCVIMIHGYAGSPDQFLFLAGQLVEDGVDCASLLLPGHGGTSREFGHEFDQEWRQHVRQEVDRLRDQYRQVVLIGHSMGGLLCLEYAAQTPVAGVISISAPMGIRLNIFQMALAMEMLFTSPGHGRPIVETYRAGFGVRMTGLFSPLAFVLPSISLFRTIRRVRRVLPLVRVPVLLIQSKKDETIWRGSADQIAGLLGRPTTILRLVRSRHAWRVPEEEAMVTSRIREMVKILASSAPDQV